VIERVSSPLLDQVQLPLEIQVKPEANFESFFVGNDDASSNGLVVSALKQIAASFSPDNTSILPETNFVIWGSAGTGKSHLLQALCQSVSAVGTGCIYLPMADVINYEPAVLEGLEHMQLVCLDDIQVIQNSPIWQEAIFHLFNRLRDRKAVLVVAADCSPLHIDIPLADLKSRLSWGLTFRLESLSEQDSRALLISQSWERGLEMTDEVADYIVGRSRRSVQDLLDTLEKLDIASLSAKRKLTRPFVKDVLGW
jgi:DnaA family protein